MSLSVTQPIADWLGKLGLSEYAVRFAESEIVLVLRYLTDQELEKIGVLLGRRRKMLAAIVELGGATRPGSHRAGLAWSVRMRHLILIVATLWFGSQVESAEITLHSPDAYGRFFVDIVGEITPNDEKAFEQKVKVLYTQYDKVIVTLSGPGGVALAAMKIGEFIHKYGWTTYVPSGTVCVSSCAIIWLAGKPRTIEGAPGVIIGFHAVYDVGTQRESGVANAVLGYHLTRWGLNDRGIACVTIAPPNEIGWLTGPNGRECGITWEVLTPARDVPLQLSPIAPSTTTAQKQQVIYLNCNPTLAANEPDPVTGIAVGLKVISQENNPHVEYFDAWHHTSKCPSGEFLNQVNQL